MTLAAAQARADFSVLRPIHDFDYSRLDGFFCLWGVLNDLETLIWAPTVRDPPPSRFDVPLLRNAYQGCFRNSVIDQLRSLRNRPHCRTVQDIDVYLKSIFAAARWLKGTRVSREERTEAALQPPIEAMLESMLERSLSDGGVPLLLEIITRSKGGDQPWNLARNVLLDMWYAFMAVWKTMQSLSTQCLTALGGERSFARLAVFPGRIRPPCTTMPWTIWPALVVLWGVCWMFYDSVNNHHQTSLIDHIDPVWFDTDYAVANWPYSWDVSQTPELLTNECMPPNFVPDPHIQSGIADQVNLFDSVLIEDVVSQHTLTTAAQHQEPTLVTHPVPATSPSVDREPEQLRRQTSEGSSEDTTATSPNASPNAGQSEFTAAARWHCDRPDCQRSFGRKYDLARHMRKHDGNRIFHCPVRGCKFAVGGTRDFKRSDHLAQHMRLSHPREALPAVQAGEADIAHITPGAVAHPDSGSSRKRSRMGEPAAGCDNTAMELTEENKRLKQTIQEQGQRIQKLERMLLNRLLASEP